MTEYYEEMVRSVWDENKALEPVDIIKKIVSEFNEKQGGKMDAHTGRSMDTEKFVNSAIKISESKSTNRRDVTVGILLLTHITKREENAKERIRDMTRVLNPKKDHMNQLKEANKNIRKANKALRNLKSIKRKLGLGTPPPIRFSKPKTKSKQSASGDFNYWVTSAKSSKFYEEEIQNFEKMLDKKECAQFLYGTNSKQQKVWKGNKLTRAKEKLRLLNKQIERV